MYRENHLLKQEDTKMIQRCLHCGEGINTHQRCSLTCYCGRPISQSVKVIGKLEDMEGINLISSNSCGYQSMYYHANLIEKDGVTMMLGHKNVYLDKENNMYTIGG